MLDNLKSMLGIDPKDNSRDNVLNIILDVTRQRLKVLLGMIDPPKSMDYIVLEVSVKRFNRIGSEGASSHTVEGESVTYFDSDFVEFSSEIQAFLDAQKDSKRGKVRFL